jgi:archaellum component FlaG (FlaF/FlaG flagellin family)
MRDITMAMRKISTGAIIAIVVIGIALTATSAGLLSVSQSVSSTGTVTAINVGVYSDVSCTQTLTSIDWGSVSPGGSVTRIIYVKNTGNAQISLSMTTANWNPSGANGPITLTWNRESTTLNPGQSTAATLTLSVSSGISGITTFSVNVVITGSG